MPVFKSAYESLTEQLGVATDDLAATTDELKAAQATAAQAEQDAAAAKAAAEKATSAIEKAQATADQASCRGGCREGEGDRGRRLREGRVTAVGGIFEGDSLTAGLASVQSTLQSIGADCKTALAGT